MGRLRLPPTSANPPPLPDQSQPSNPSMINSEITSLLAVMRRNSRYSSHSLDHSLILSLKLLRRNLFSSPSSLTPLLYLRPFLDIIRSDETGAPITSVALSSLHKILSFDVFDDRTERVEEAMNAAVDAVTGCRFEITDPASEEAVLMKILQVLLACLRSRAAGVVSDQRVCNVVNTCFRVVHQAGGKGELLQRFSRMAMHEVVRCVFARLPEVGKGSSVIEVCLFDCVHLVVVSNRSYRRKISCTSEWGALVERAVV